MIGAVANHLWQSTVFAAGITILTVMYRTHQARVRHALWLVASIKFLLPLSVPIGLGACVSWSSATRPAIASIATTAALQISEPFTGTNVPALPTANPHVRAAV